jgi:hypothetical protein
MIAKFVPGFATVAPPMAGAFKLSLPLFLAYSAVGAALWAGAAVAVGVVFHAEVDWVLRWIADMGGRAISVVAGLVLAYVALKWLERRLFMRFMRMMRITPAELHHLMQESPGPVILDARSAAARRLDPRRIAGALLVDTATPALQPGEVPVERDVVIYCT